MKIFLLLLFFRICCCEIKFSARARNCSVELVYHINEMLTGGHMAVWPFGVWTLMTGLTIGATGSSYKELRRALVLPKDIKNMIEGYRNLTQIIQDPTATGVTMTNKDFVFLDKGFSINPNFKKTLLQDFGAVINVLDFKYPNSAARIASIYIDNVGGNAWNMLVLDDLTDSRMIYSNIISFKGIWLWPFDKTKTTVEPFYNENREIIGRVNMMYQSARVSLSNVETLKAFVIELPYGRDDKYSMVVILPYPNTALKEMYKNLAEVTLDNLMKRLQNDVDKYGPEMVDIRIPRFKVSTNVVLNKPLNDMGLYNIFDPPKSSFFNLTNDNLFVLAIIHKATIEVTESGTFASQAISTSSTDESSSSSFVANRPFLYFLLEKSTTTIIFAGIYSKPSLYY